MKICVYTICKNEINNIDKWLDCMNEADYMLLVDTGSTDGTYEKLLSLKSMYPKLIVKQISVSPFRFDVARNEAIKFIPKDTDICVSMDLDELFYGKGWSKCLKSVWKPSYKLGNLIYQDNKENNIYEKRSVTVRTKIHCLGAMWKYPLHEVLVTDVNDVCSGDNLKINQFLSLCGVDCRTEGWYSLIVNHTSHKACTSSYVNLANTRCKEYDNAISDQIKVMELFKNKKYDECLAFIDEIQNKEYNKDSILTRNLTYSSMNFYRGYIYENYKNNISLAINYYNKSLETGIIQYSSLLQLSKIYYSKNKKEKIIALLQHPLENWVFPNISKNAKKYDELDIFLKEELTKYYNLCK